MDIEIILKAENKASIEELIGDLLDKKYFKITEIDSYEAKEKLKKVKKEPKNEKISEEKAEEKTEVKAEIKETVKKEIIIPEETGETAKKEMTTIRVNTVKLDNLVNIVGELIVAHSSLRTFKKSIVEDKLEDFEKIILDLDNITKSMQEDVLSVRMIPIGNTFVQFKRMIRDVSKKMSKKVKFEIKGGETEIDKTIIEKIVDPLRHMIRNSVDHGIEPTEERIKAGKSEEGVIKINAFHQGGEVIIEIFDDGKGLDKEALLKKAIEKKLISGYENLPDEEIYSLIFAPGFSTKEVVTELSGRGVGMDVVKNNIEELSGKVEIESEKGKYTMFKIRLPLTLAIIDGMLVRVGENIYVIPILSIAESFQPKETNIKKIQGKDDVLEIRGEYYPLIKLFKLFKIKESIEDPLKSTVLIIETHKGKIAMMVDEVVDNQQIVIKKLDLSHKEIDKFSGATILGTGEVALILDIKSIYDSMFRKIAGGEASE